jgi:hypothetical protein
VHGIDERGLGELGELTALRPKVVRYLDRLGKGL